METEQIDLLNVPPDWREHWVGMPDFEQRDLSPWQTVEVNFKGPEDKEAFFRLIGQKPNDKAPFIWYPKVDRINSKDKRYRSSTDVQPKYPIYVISKGRWESRLTVKYLQSMGVYFEVVVEPQEYEQYAAVIPKNQIRVLPFSNLGQGSIPARNWVWENAIANGFERHWILDDNIQGFYRLHNNRKALVGDGTMFRAAEVFTDRYTNIALSGFNYEFFAPRRDELPPYYLNTRIYSCILIRNDLPYRWRGRYNEDTDLSIRALKDGHCTVLFNTFLCKKVTTMKMKGGNTDELYKGNGRLKMAQSLVDQHPEIVSITEKWGRPQHLVDYSPFKDNRLKRNSTPIDPEGFKMELLDKTL